MKDLEKVENAPVNDMETKKEQQMENFAAEVQKEKKVQKVRVVTQQTLLYIVLTIAALISIFPFIYMILVSFMPHEQYDIMSGLAGLMPTFRPNEMVNYDYGMLASRMAALYGKDFEDVSFFEMLFANYKEAFSGTIQGAGGDLHIGQVLINTLLVASSSVLFGMIVLILSAYAFARLEFKGKNIIFSFLLFTMMIPGELFTITNYTTIYNLNLAGTLTALVVPFMVSVYYIYLLRNNFKQIPNELYKAAKVDGVGDFKYLVTVMIPLAAPTIISITILKVISVWNSYIWPNLVNTGSNALLISNWMAQAGRTEVGGLSMTVVPIKLAAAMVVTLPLLIIFIFFRKYIMRGVSKSGIKG